MVITKEKPVVDIQKIKIKDLKYTTKKVIKSQGKAAREEEGNKKLQNSKKTMNKMTVISPHLSIIIHKWINVSKQKT